jgi:LacI family gluconate utilization system Gnt-I transcriptional repressor
VNIEAPTRTRTTKPRKRTLGRATIADVAQIAGVSPMTVSRALKDSSLVTRELRERVMAAVAELGYVPNLAAQTLASARSNLVGVIIPSLSNSVFIETLTGIRDCLSVAGYQIIIGETLYSADQERQLLSTHLARAIDGVLVTGIDLDADVRRGLLARNIPLVHMFDINEEPEALSVGFSQFQAGAEVGRYLLARGYRRPALIAAQLDPRSLKRIDGFRRALAEAGVGNVGEMLTPEPTSIALGGNLLSRLLAASPDRDAVFCVNDDLALGALFECQRRGLRVPDDLAIVGFNDLPYARLAVPSITSVTTPRYEIGFQAAHLMLRQLNGEPLERRALDLGFKLAARDSA